MSVEEAIRSVITKSEIAFGSTLYGEIYSALTDIGLNLAFFVFETSRRSSCARTLDGRTVSCPVLSLYLKYDGDFRQTGIDPHGGNWDDQWAQTRTIRAALNAILQRHGLGNTFLSDHTFVFVRTREELAFQRIGRDCKSAVQQLISAEAAGVSIDSIYWNGDQYDVLLRDKSHYDLVQGDVKTKVAQALPQLLAGVDEHHFCQTYDATIEFHYPGPHLPQLYRDDID